MCGGCEAAVKRILGKMEGLHLSLHTVHYLSIVEPAQQARHSTACHCSCTPACTAASILPAHCLLSADSLHIVRSDNIACTLPADCTVWPDSRQQPLAACCDQSCVAVKPRHTNGTCQCPLQLSCGRAVSLFQIFSSQDRLCCRCGELRCRLEAEEGGGARQRHT